MKSNDFISKHEPKLSPFCSNLAPVINEAIDCVDGDDVNVRQVPVTKILFTVDADEANDDQSINRFNNLPFAVLMDGYYHLLDGHGLVMEAINSGFNETLLFVGDCDDEELIEARRKKKKKKSRSRSPVAIPFYGRWWYGGGYHHHHDDSSSGGDEGGGGDGGGGE